MSLYKIPIIILLAQQYNAILTPPYAPPPKEEMVSSTAIDSVRARRYRLAFAQIGQIIVALAEVLVIAAAAFPSSRISAHTLYYLPHPSGGSNRLQMSAGSLLGAFLLICGTQTRKWTFRELGRFFRFDISIQKDHKLIATGPYSYVRHPAYTGMLLSNIGWLVWTFTKGSWVRESGMLHTIPGALAIGIYICVGILPTSIVTLSRMSREDVALRTQFGSQWDDWRRRVPYSIIPGVY